MNKSWFYLSAIASLAILTTSCGDGGKPATPVASPTTAASPTSTPTAAVPTTPTPPVATTPPTVAATAPTAPTVPGKPVATSVAAVGLIAPTNGDNWAKTVSKGRSDPFATLVLQPVVAAKNPLDPTGRLQPASSTIATNNPPTIKSGVNRSLPAIRSGTKVGSNGLNNKTKVKALPGSSNRIAAIPKSGVNKALPKITVGSKIIKPSNPKIVKIAKNNVLRPVTVQPTTSKTGTTPIATKPEKVVEKPLQAMALEISGVIEVGGKTQVIVKLPTESFSRYIEVGDRVANGKVLVKRVEGQQSLSPTVVLEEVGVEVPRKIGDKPAASTPQSTPKP